MQALRASNLAVFFCVAGFGCAGSQGASEAVVTVKVERVAPDASRSELKVDDAKVVACVGRAKEIPIDRVAKSVLPEGEYDLRLESGNETRELNLFNQQNFGEGEAFFESDCLYDLVTAGA